MALSPWQPSRISGFWVNRKIEYRAHRRNVAGFFLKSAAKYPRRLQGRAGEGDRILIGSFVRRPASGAEGSSFLYDGCASVSLIHHPGEEARKQISKPSNAKEMWIGCVFWHSFNSARICSACLAESEFV
ncbi:MAG: hypothetical protein ACLSH1_02575 [Clostridia bacterium]